MYHPLAMDLLRVQQDELRRRTSARRRTPETTDTTGSAGHRSWWPRRPRRSALALACVDC